MCTKLEYNRVLSIKVVFLVFETNISYPRQDTGTLEVPGSG